MGACLKTESYPNTGRNKAEKKMNWHRQGSTDHSLWAQILLLSFDQPSFSLVHQLQNAYTDISGAFLSPEPLLAILLEFKRFLYLLALEGRRLRAEQGPHEGLLPVSCKYAPSPFVDRVWRLLLNNEGLYETLCMKIFEGYKFERDSLLAVDPGSYTETLMKIRAEFPLRHEQIWSELPKIQDSPFLMINVPDFIEFHEHFQHAVRKEPQISIESEIQALRAKIARTQESISQELKLFEEDGEENILDEKELYMMETLISIDPTDLVPDDDQDLPNLPKQDTLVKQVSQEPDQIKKLMKNFANKKAAAPSQPARVLSQRLSPRKDGIQIGKNYKTDIGVYRGAANMLDQEEEDKQEISHDWLREDWAVVEASIWAKLRPLNIAPLAKRTLSVELNTSREVSNAIFEEYKKFLLLIQLVKPEYRPLPSRMIELAWRYHMAETASYSKFKSVALENAGGSFKFLFYEIEEKSLEDYGETLELYSIVFRGPPPAYLWPKPEKRFDLNSIYSAKLVNVAAYMERVIEKVKGRAGSMAENSILTYEKRKALSGMKMYLAPLFGKKQILMKGRKEFRMEKEEHEESFMSFHAKGDMGSMFSESYK